MHTYIHASKNKIEAINICLEEEDRLIYINDTFCVKIKITCIYRYIYIKKYI